MAIRWLRHHPDITVTFGVAAIVRLLMLMLALQQNGSDYLFRAAPDTVNYVSIAQDILNGALPKTNASFSFPPGYPGFMAGVMLLFGHRSVPIVLIQILLSSMTCVLIARLALRLTNSRSVSLIAGLLAATSMTSISLSCIPLSDCLYHFLFVVAVWKLLNGLDSGRWRPFVWFGILTGVSILVRPIGQAWPLMTLLLAAAYLAASRVGGFASGAVTARNALFRTAISALLAFAVVLPWLIRNKILHGIVAVSFTTAGGPANIAALAEGARESKSRPEIQTLWADNFKREQKLDQLTIEQLYGVYSRETSRVIRAHPWQMADEYFSLTWENLTDLNYLDRILVPQFKPTSINLAEFIKGYWLNYLNVALSAAGLMILFVRRRWRTLAVVGIIYLYCVATLGFYPWQGSRYFLPGMTAWAILIGVLVDELSRGICRGVRALARHRSSISWRATPH